MNEQIKIAIAEKVKNGALNCHNKLKTYLTCCEPKYVGFYEHALEFFGCEITENIYNRYLRFMVVEPEKLNRSIEDCVSSYVDAEKEINTSWIIPVVIFLSGFILGWMT